VSMLTNVDIDNNKRKLKFVEGSPEQQPIETTNSQLFDSGRNHKESISDLQK
jgi:hypothetical protein